MSNISVKKYQGYIYALFAALFNGTIGIFSVKIMETGLGPFAIAFYKCLIALIITTSWFVVSGQFYHWINYIKKLWWQLPLTAFFGFFVLYFFETNAYKYENVTIVVFMLLGAAVITTFLLSSIINKRWLKLNEVLSCSLAILGLALIFGINIAAKSNYIGIILSIIAGIGYGMFLTLSPYFKIGSGLIVVNSLMLFGTLYLFIPFAYEGWSSINNIHTFTLLLLLALLPTIGGFLCTTKALTLLKSESVQLIELSEPLFAVVLSAIFLSQFITLGQMLGGILVLISIFINHKHNRSV